MQEILDLAVNTDFRLSRSLFEMESDSPWPRHILNEVELESRRLVILRALYPDKVITANGPVGEFWRTYLEEVGDVDESTWAFDETTVSGLYAEVFDSPLPDLWTGRNLARLMDATPGIAG